MMTGQPIRTYERFMKRVHGRWRYMVHIDTPTFLSPLHGDCEVETIGFDVKPSSPNSFTEIANRVEWYSHFG